MKLYPIPGGGWAATEADWKVKMKAAGFDPKNFPDKFREVPTNPKNAFIEWLTFYAVDVYRLGAGETPPTVDVEALRALHNPEAPPAPQADPVVDQLAAAAKMWGDPRTGLDAAFAAAPISTQLRLAVGAIDRADAVIQAAVPADPR